jgi:hypothetical protein
VTGQVQKKVWHWHRGAIVTATFLIACSLYLALSITQNTTFEHDKFAGPLVFLATTRQPTDNIIGGTMLAFLGSGLCLPAFRINVTTVIAWVLSAVAWIGISMLAAASAAV